MDQSEFNEIKELFPRLRGLVDDKVDRELYFAFHRVYDYFNNKINDRVVEIRRSSRSDLSQLEERTSQLVNNFATRLIGAPNSNNPLSELGSGTVVSVSATGNLLFSISGSPITESGTLSFSLNVQSANEFLAGPVSGAAATPTFRVIDKDDINIPFKLTTSTNADPTTTEYPDQTWGIHKNTTSGDVFVVYNDGGIIKKVLLT